MKVAFDAATLKLASKRLQPARRYKSMRESLVTVMVAGTSLGITGTPDSRVLVEAEVHQSGSAEIPLGSAIKLLGTY